MLKTFTTTFPTLSALSLLLSVAASGCEQFNEGQEEVEGRLLDVTKFNSEPRRLSLNQMVASLKAGGVLSPNLQANSRLKLGDSMLELSCYPAEQENTSSRLIYALNNHDPNILTKQECYVGHYLGMDWIGCFEDGLLTFLAACTSSGCEEYWN